MSERNLLYAVIETAVEDAKLIPEKFRLQIKKEEARALKRDAIKWLKSEDKKFMSFEWYCALVDFPPSAIRKKLNI